MTAGKIMVSLVSLDRTEYTAGDEFNYTLEVKAGVLLNGAVPGIIKVPTVFNVADLEPDDPNVSFDYTAMEISLTISDELYERRLSVPLLRLYGSDEMPWTEIALIPGTSIEIRGKAKLKPVDPEEKFFDEPYLQSTEAMQQGEV